MNYGEISKIVYRQQRVARNLLADPLSAFIAARHPERIDGPIRQFFAGALNAACAHRRWIEMARLSGSPDQAFVEFTKRLRILLDSWIVFAPDAISWCKWHQDLYEEVIAAQLHRRTAIALPDLLTEYTQKEADGKARLIVLSKIYGQSSYAGAANMAALILFGDFLVGDPGSIRFCAREGCREPFLPSRSDKVFHSGSCGRTVSGNRTHENDKRNENRAKLREYADRLLRWTKTPAGDWRDAIEPNKKGRRLLSICITATQSDSDEAMRQVIERCFDTRLNSSRDLENDIREFLSQIKKAMEIRPRRSGQ